MVQSRSSRIPCLLRKVRLVVTNQSFQLGETNYLYIFLQHESDELISKQSTGFLDTILMHRHDQASRFV
jgi:hypothetical protein